MSIRTSLSDKRVSKALSKISDAQERVAARFPGDSGARQPVHTVYGGAQIFTAETARKLGDVALRSLETYAGDAQSFAEVIGVAPELAGKVYERVREKLTREPVEDFRIDFEDGYGNRPDAEEDEHAKNAGREVAAGLAAGTLPPFLGIRVKPFTEELAGRSIRTLDLFVTALTEASGGKIPDGFVVTLPKVQTVAQVVAFADVLDALEGALGLTLGTLKIELMIETTQAIVDASGTVALPGLVRAGRGRVSGCHFGTYDYTATCNITAAYQSMQHPACDFATHMMQVALAQTGVWMSDGATTVMPVPAHRAKAGESLSPEQVAENKAAVMRAWQLAFDNVMHSLTRGIYQGWDLHPGQLVARYAAIYSFFLASFQGASQRLDKFMSVAATATLSGDVFDDAATGQGLLNYFLRALNCGAVTEAEVVASGLSLEELRTRSFVKILAGRRSRMG